MQNVRKVLIVGAGAIGGTLGALLARAGQDVTFLTRGERAASDIRSHGMTVRGVRGELSAPARAEPHADGLNGPFDTVMVAVKAYDLRPALLPVVPLIPAGCPVVSLQNGICIEELEALVGAERAVGCSVGWGATMHGPAEMELTSEGELVIGCRSPAGRAGCERAAELLRAAFPTSVSDDILATLYSKLIVNSCITTLGAISGRTAGWMFSRSLYRTLFIRIIREAMDVAHAAGIRVPAYGGRLDYEAFVRGSGPFDELRRHLLIRLIGFRYRRLKSSSLQSLERGKPTEVDWLNGYIVRTGRAHGVEVSLNEKLTSMVHEIESGARRIGPENFSAESMRLS